MPSLSLDELTRIVEINAAVVTDEQIEDFVQIGESLGLSRESAQKVIIYALNREFARIEEAQDEPPAEESEGEEAEALASELMVYEDETEILPDDHSEIEIINELDPPTAQGEAEQAAYPDFVAPCGVEMLLIPSGKFSMGSKDPGSPQNERPVSVVSLPCFFLARFPVRNIDYEQFDPAHRSKRLGSASDDHPVVFVSHGEATKFCEWLSGRDRRYKFRLPTEAEWEDSARGVTARNFPWGNHTNVLLRANFADAGRSFSWRDMEVDHGYAETAPVGQFPLGRGPFGHEDLAGNVWEWCSDYYDFYRGGSKSSPRGPQGGKERIYRGGSWKSRVAGLRATARGYNLPNYSCNDVGFRIACDVSTV